MEENEQNYKKDLADLEPEQQAELTAAFTAQNEKDQKERDLPIQLPYEQRDFVICMDTCGQEREISPLHQAEIVDLVRFYAKCWEETELVQFQQDIDIYNAYLDKFNRDEKGVYDKLCEQEENHVKNAAGQLDKWVNYEKIFEYEQNTLRLERVKKQLQSQEVQEWLQTLASFRLVQFAPFIEVLFIFLGFDSETLCQAYTGNLKWMELRHHFVDEAFINKMVDFEHIGPKPDKCPAHLKIKKFLPYLNKFNEADINEFNLGLGRIFRWFSLTLRCRQGDVEKRKELKLEARAARAKATEEKEKWEQEKEQHVQRAFEVLAEEERPNFDKAAAEQAYIAEYPEVVIPDDVQSDVDDDME